MVNPRIVVGMGAWNEAQYLNETIPAVLAQTMPDFGLLLIDNGSTDETYDIIRQWAATDERIVYTNHRENLSPPVAANVGWGRAMRYWPDCQWFVGQGADDLMDADYLESILAAASDDQTRNCIFSPAKFIGQRGEWHYPKYNPAKVHVELQVPGWRAFTRDLWTALGGEYEGMGAGSDWEWVVRASVQGLLRPYQLPTPKLARRIRNNRKSQSDMTDPQLHPRLRALAGVA